MSYLEEILEKDFLWRSSANKKSEINKKFTENNIRLKERMEEVNADAMSLKKVLLTLPQEERTIFFREYNRKKVQIQMLTKQLNRKNHIIFKGLYQQIIPSNFKDFDIDF